MKKQLTEEVRNYAKDLGVDLFGIAPVERFKNAPKRMSPKGLLPEAKSVIVVGIHHLDSAVELGGYPTAHDVGPYGTQGSMNSMLDDFSFKIGRFLEDKGHKTLSIAATNIWRYYEYKNLKVNFAPDLVHRYAAVAAGLGEIGWSGLFLSPQFGPRQRLISIITEANLLPSPMYNGKPLCDKCMECVKHCPTDAFRKEVKKINKIEIGGRIFEFPDTNKWRCAWAENFGLSLDLPIPEKVDEKTILENLEKYGRRGGEEGSCLKFCMIPQKRYYDKNYSLSPRRKNKKLKISSDEIIKKFKEIAKENFVDFISVGNKEDFKNNKNVHPEYYLPEVKSVICIGMKNSTGKNDDLESSVNRRLSLLSFKIAHYFDILGYPSITNNLIPDTLVSQQLGIYERDTQYRTILTSAKLPFINSQSKNNRSSGIDKEEIKKFCEIQGTDLIGFFSKKRYRELKENAEKHFSMEYFYIRDIGGYYGAFVPEVERVNLRFKKLEDYLPEAKSTIVIGLHFPDSSVDTAKITPAETVGPYAFSQYESLRLLGDIGLNVVKYLQRKGYKATLTYDLSGISSYVESSRGELPDLKSNRFAVLLSGLGYIGNNGIPITKKYGQRQRFISIITDFPFSNDPLYDGEITCEECSHPCIKECPTQAIKGKKNYFALEGKKLSFPEIDNLKCDWAKRYGLSGKEGPDYYGVDSNIPPPREITPEKLSEAVSKIKWGVQKRHINICEECLRVCPYKGDKKNG